LLNQGDSPVPDLKDLCNRVIAEVKPYSMAPAENLAATVQLTVDVVANNRPGELVECGTWMGGSSFAMLLAQRYGFGRILKPVWMFDSFEGLPQADERDGPLALQYQADPSAPGYFNNCAAPLDQVRAAIARFGFSDEEAKVVPGWFDQTIPVQLPALTAAGIALLRVDCDWYEPVRYVLSELSPLVGEECPIILDDYYAWDGCARATHAFLAQNDLSWRIRSIPNYHGIWMIKRRHRTRDQAL
jgi:O-methyltransferase